MGTPNRLVDALSPYLRQHAHNPVDWYPWGDAALERARQEQRPIFLSIGYAACHWCHVMERESFSDPKTAAFLNAHFVPVKVDREERPDLDAVYMAAVQAITGGGGWPLNVFLTPQGEPFHGGTYFPPERRWGRPSFRDVLEAVAAAWRERRGEVIASSASLLAHLHRAEQPGAPSELDLTPAVRRFLERLDKQLDRTAGGFGDAPKFPTPSRLYLLLDLASASTSARDMLTLTLDGMAAGGMHDWLGGGFHRYSVDGGWLVPHFEKMLYDNALLARLYGWAALRLGEARWAEIARQAAGWMLDEMQGPEGGFYASTDADDPQGEGSFFTWTAAEVHDALPADQARLVVALCDLDGAANFERGRSVLRPSHSLAAAAEAAGMAAGEAEEALSAARRGLLAARRRRIPPSTDDKQLAGWNGMAVWALAWLGVALPEPRFLEAAERAGRFLLQRVGPDGRLERAWRDGSASGTETLEDVAWVATSWLQLFEVTGEASWLQAVSSLVARRLAHYVDAGAIHDTPDDGPALVLRPRNPMDGATPASGAVAVQLLARLAAVTGEIGYRDLAERLVGTDALAATRAPEAAPTLLSAAAALAAPPRSVVVAGNPARATTRELYRTALVQSPADVVVLLSPPGSYPGIGLSPDMPPPAGEPDAMSVEALAYLCEGGACHAPVASPTELSAALALLGPILGS
ncbi:MAG TPA: thioredoxin domain-containing protein [Thermoanaerobaculaceae bacterium]|nr:thioredoxin domain-containing protein [Thermoanaerobaculaceae bacterium]